MANPQNPVESALFRSYWDDGLLDLFCGVGLLGVGIGFETDLVVFAALMPVVLTPLWRPFRAWLVEPRGGYVRFSQSRRSRSTRELRLTAMLGLAALILAVSLFFAIRINGESPLAAYLVPGLPAALVGIGLALGGWLTGARRFLWYAIALATAAVATIVVGGNPGAPLVAVGVIVVAIGAILLSRFLRDSRDYLHSEGS